MTQRKWSRAHVNPYGYDAMGHQGSSTDWTATRAKSRALDTPLTTEQRARVMHFMAWAKTERGILKTTLWHKRDLVRVYMDSRTHRALGYADLTTATPTVSLTTGVPDALRLRILTALEAAS